MEKEKLDRPKKASREKILVKIPTQERSRHTVAAILESCSKLLISEGFYAITTETIAQDAGVSVGSLYQFFGNKESIVQALVMNLMIEDKRIFSEKMQNLPDYSAEERIKAIIEITINIFRRDIELRSTLNSIQYYVTEPEVIVDYIHFFQEMIKNNLPVLPGRSPDRYAYLLSSSIIGFANTALITNPRNLNEPYLTRDLSELFLKHLILTN